MKIAHVGHLEVGVRRKLAQTDCIFLSNPSTQYILGFPMMAAISGH